MSTANTYLDLSSQQINYNASVSPINNDQINSYIDRINACKTTEELNSVQSSVNSSIAGTNESIQSHMSNLTPAMALTSPPSASLGSLFSYATTIKNTIVTPYVQPLIAYGAAIVALGAAVTSINSAISAKKTALGDTSTPLLSSVSLDSDLETALNNLVTNPNTAPSNPSVGDVWQNGSGVIFQWNGSNWIQVDSSSGSSLYTKEAEVYLYQWNTTVPDAPDGTSSYNWTYATNSNYLSSDSWTVNVPTNPGISGIYLWITKQTITEAFVNNTTAVTWDSSCVVERSNFNNKALGLLNTVVKIYKWDITIPSGPTATSTYTWSSKAISSIPSGWSTLEGTSPSPGYTLWEASVSLMDSSSVSTTTINWINASISPVGYAGTTGSPGITGSSVDIIFKRSSSQPSTPSDSSSTPTGWYSNVADVPSGSNTDYIYSCVGTKTAGGSLFVWEIPVKLEAETTFIYTLNSSSYVTSRDVDGNYTPNDITFSASVIAGDATPANYSGRFKIYVNESGTPSYTSSSNESSKSFTIPANTTSISVELYEAGGTSTKLDETTVAVVNDGDNAAIFSIDSSGVTFSKDGVGTITPSSTTLSTSYSNITSPSYKWYKNNSEISGATSSSYAVPSSDYSSVATNTYKCIVTGTINGSSGQTLSDSITIPRLDSATNNPTVILSNENISFTGPTSGYSGITFTSGSCDVSAFIGSIALTYGTSGANTFSIGTLSTSGVTVTNTNATINAPSAMSADSAYVDVPVTLRNSLGNTATTITVRITYSLSRKGTTGDTGASAAIFSIDSSAVTFKKDQAGTITPSSTTLSTSYSNITSPSYKWYKNSIEISGATSSSYAVSNSEYSSVVTNTYKCIITGTINGSTGQTREDSITIPLLLDSVNTLTTVLSNENITFAGPVSGYSGITFTGGSCTISVFQGTTALTYGTSGANTFSIGTLSTSGVTVTNTNATINAPTAMSSDSAYVDVPITIRDASNTATTITVRITYSLSRKGTTGDTGASAAIFSIDSSAVTFSKDGVGTITPSSITLSTSYSNISSPSYKWYKNNSEISGATSSSYAVSNSDYSSVATNTYKCIITGTINGSTGQTREDSITIPRLDSATNNPTVILSNENITFAGPLSGYSGIVFNGGTSTISAFIGSIALTYGTSGANTFSIGTLSTSGVTVTNTNATINAPTAMSADSAYVDVPVTLRNSLGNTATTITVRITYSLARAGVNTLEVVGDNLNANNNGYYGAYLKINNGSSNGALGRGHTLFVIEPSTSTLDSSAVYDTYGSGTGTLITAINAVSAGKIIVLTSYDATSCDSDLRSALLSCGGRSYGFWSAARTSHVFIGMKGLLEGQGYEDYNSNSDATGVISIKASFNQSKIIFQGSTGSNSLTAVLSNESHSVPSASDGTPSSYTGSGTDIYVVEKGNYLTYVTSITGINQFTVSTSTSGITSGAISTGTSPERAIVAAHSAMTSNPAFVTYTITAKNSQSVTSTITKVQTITKSIAGINASTLSLSSTAQSFTYDGTGTASPSSQTISFTANLQNVSGTATFTATAYNSSGTSLGAITLSGTGNTRTMTNAQFLAPGATSYAVVSASLSGYSDQITVVKLQAGSAGSNGTNGTTPIVGYLTNESTTLSAAVDGTVSSFTPASGTFMMFSGVTDVTTSSTFSKTSETGMTSSINASTGSYSVTAMSSDTASATYTGTYNGVTIIKILNLSKSKTGIQGNDGLSVAELSIYKRSASAPSTPTGGSYDFSTTTTTPPSGWSSGVPSGTDPVYISKAVAVVTGTTGTDSTLTWSSPVISFQNGGTGGTGVTGASARVMYTRIPGSPSPTSGTITVTGDGLPTQTQSNTTWGLNYAWSATDPNTSSTNSLFTADGIYTPSTGNTVWSTPYLASLKVGTLSAITTNTGDLTVSGSIKAKSGSTDPAISGTSMTGAGAIINSAGTFAMGNANTNISFNGTQMTLNGEVVANGNLTTNAISTVKVQDNAITNSIGAYTVSPQPITYVYDLSWNTIPTIQSISSISNNYPLLILISFKLTLSSLQSFYFTTDPLKVRLIKTTNSINTTLYELNIPWSSFYSGENSTEGRVNTNITFSLLDTTLEDVTSTYSLKVLCYVDTAYAENTSMTILQLKK